MKASFSKKIFSFLIILLICFVTLELSPFVLAPVLLKQSFSRKDIPWELKQASILIDTTDRKEVKEDEYIGGHVLHPYIGWVNIPGPGINNYGFPGIDPIVKKSSETINICIMEGSVAFDLFSYAGAIVR